MIFIYKVLKCSFDIRDFMDKKDLENIAKRFELLNMYIFIFFFQNTSFLPHSINLSDLQRIC